MAVENGSTPESPPVEVPAKAPEAAPAAVSNSDATAAPSTAKDESLMDRVTAALQPKTAGSSPATGSQEAAPNPEASPESDDKEPEGDPTDEELARFHSKTRKRLSKLMTERNSARDEADQLRPHADVGRKITSFIADSGMSSDEANLLLDIGRNMKRDPLKALEQLKPYYDALSQMSGDKLPADLQDAVAKGEITEGRAREFQRTRTQSQVLSQRTQAQDEADRSRVSAENTQRFADSVSSTISTWDRNQAQSDPDWNLKQGRIGELIELDIRRNGYPQTAQAAVDLAEKAKTQVAAEHARFQPRKLAVNSVNPASATRIAPAKPRNAYEAAEQALSAMRG
jgi:hypothetical protein